MTTAPTLDALNEQIADYLNMVGRNEYTFALQPDKAALLIVDMQQFVCAPSDGRHLSGIKPVITAINNLADTCHSCNVPVIWLRHTFNTNNIENDAGLYPLFHKQPLSPDMFDKGPATEIFTQMHVDETKDHVVFKNRYSAFAKDASNLHDLLQNLAIKQLWITGVATNVCVESTARDAMQLNYETIMIANAMASPFELVHQVILQNFRLFYGDVRYSESILEALLPNT